MHKNKEKSEAKTKASRQGFFGFDFSNDIKAKN
jgi:hypothetical protein